MTNAELLRLVLKGHLIVVGEYRGGRAEAAGYVDRKTGEAIKYVSVIHLVECTCRGTIDRAIIRQRRPDLENPEDVGFPLAKGRRYAYFLEGFRIERGQFSGWMGAREPEPIETDSEAGCAPRGAPPPLNLVI